MVAALTHEPEAITTPIHLPNQNYSRLQAPPRIRDGILPRNFLSGDGHHLVGSLGNPNDTSDEVEQDPEDQPLLLPREEGRYSHPSITPDQTRDESEIGKIAGTFGTCFHDVQDVRYPRLTVASADWYLENVGAENTWIKASPSSLEDSCVPLGRKSFLT